MSDNLRIIGNRVFCHACQHQWDRSQGGLECPECGGEFVEIIEDESELERDQPDQPSAISSSPLHPSFEPIRNHNPWAPDPDIDDITTFEFNAGGNTRGTVSFTSRSFTYPHDGTNRGDAATQELGRNFESMLAGILGGRRHVHMTGSGFFQYPGSQAQSRGDARTNQMLDPLSLLISSMTGARPQNQQQGPFDFFSMLLNPGNARRGDMVFSQEDFDRVMTQLMEQNGGTGAPPASEAALDALERKRVDQDMLGSDGEAECSICMENVIVGDEVTVLPCKHWFHGECVTSWLKEHDTCPHCRQSITSTDNTPQQPTSASRMTRRSSSMTDSRNSSATEAVRYGPQVMHSSSEPRETRRRYYSDMQDGDLEGPGGERHSNSRSNRNSDNGAGGVGGWIRNHMPF